jgi:hypothetical protein
MVQVGAQHRPETSPQAPDCGGWSAQLANSNSLTRGDHGFRRVVALDGRLAVEVTIPRDDGTTVTYHLCRGARGKPCKDLQSYAASELKGARLVSHDEFEAMAALLLRATTGLNDVKGRLQTSGPRDAVLEFVYNRVQEGVRTNEGVSWIVVGKVSTEQGSTVSSGHAHSNVAPNWCAGKAHNFFVLVAVPPRDLE